MKKRLSLFLLALLVSSAVAQTGNLRFTSNSTAGLPDLFGTLAPANFKPRITSEIATKANFTGLDAFFTNVAYAGAVDPAAATPWVGESWVNWNPQTATYAAPTATLDGSYTGISATTINGVDALEITSNLSLPAGVYSLPSNIFVRSGATLTIAAGSVLRGVGTLVIQRGAKLIAAGTATTPIVFTSANAAGSRAAGDNGGIVLLGRARNNNTNGNGFVEGFPEGNDASRYGYGDNSITQDDQDSSGVLRYVRIEFAGKILSPNNEINSLTLGGVGSKTVIDHIQCSWGKDDSYEWFGGTVNAKYLIAYATSDDDFDTDRGFSGKVQFALAVRDASTAESTAGESRGFESDNWVVASQFANPRTTAVFSNVTLVGANLAGTQVGSATNGLGAGMQLRRNTSLRIYNSVVAGFVSLINLADAETNNNYGNSQATLADSLLVFNNSVLIGSTANVFLRNGTNDAAAYQTGIATRANLNYTQNAAAGLPSLFNTTLSNAQFQPQTSAQISTHANFAGNLLENDAFFTTVNYIGAVPPAGTASWTEEAWVNWNPQTATYAAPTATLDGSYTGISATTINGVSVLEIAANLSLPAGVYSLPTDIYVRSGATLTIAAGSVLRGVGTLVIQRGGKLIAAGTATSPIVFTSALDAGSRAAGDNGGIVLLGRARNNNTNGNARVDGFPPGADAAAVYGYGDNGFTQDDQDSSGVLRYVRIEFAGKVLSTGNEVNSLTMGGVGSKTVIDHIQCSWGKDDSYEWFGGTVNAKYLIAYASSDDDFDTDRGFSGKVQFALAVRDASTAESTAGESRGFESDNWVVASQFANPRTTAVFSNVTLVGANLAGTQVGSATNGLGAGMQLRRNTSLRIYNSVVAGFVSLINLADAETNNNYKVLSQDSLLTVENTALIGSTANVFLRNGTNDATVYVAGEIVTARGSKKEVASVNKIVAYPNPARDVVNFALELKNAAQVELVLRNLNGQVVATQTAQLQSGEQTLQQNISNLRKGLYIATVLVDGQVAESFRISVMQ